ncbi:hypothetical protein MUK42_03062 [Musa troglodytarum]|uniref:Uncharacterized protein n=1 Tax=Musa troglodytarum TaxID=320322 RepID=A0A9E7K388_9LILI|nr:hypothetical protein MUK42_03062 [Musa troglodytarum]
MVDGCVEGCLSSLSEMLFASILESILFLRKRSPSSTAEGSKAEQKTKMKQVERKMRYLDLAKAIAGINITGHSDLANPGGASREMSSGGRSCRRPGMQ